MKGPFRGVVPRQDHDTMRPPGGGYGSAGVQPERHLATVDRPEGCAIFRRPLSFVLGPVDGRKSEKLRFFAFNWFGAKKI